MRAGVSAICESGWQHGDGAHTHTHTHARARAYLLLVVAEIPNKVSQGWEDEVKDFITLSGV